jgi:hypothetical protein
MKNTKNIKHYGAVWFSIVAWIGLVLGRGPLQAADSVLAVGDLPLTQNTLDNLTRFRTWLLDIGLSDAGWQEYRQRVLAEWPHCTPAARRDLLNDAQRWGMLQRLSEAKRPLYRAKRQPQFLDHIRKATASESCKLLVEVYDEAHRVLVVGEVPLTQGSLLRLISQIEWLLDISLTMPQREHFQQMMTRSWNEMDQAVQRNIVNLADSDWPSVCNLRGYERRLLHAQRQPAFVESLRQMPNDASSCWALDLYERAHKPGGELNPVVVKGEPALTQEMLNLYCDYAEYTLDLSLSGGFTTQQRQLFQEFLIKAWDQKDHAGKEDLQNELKQWSEASRLSDRDRNEWLKAAQPRLLAQLTSANDEASRWLLNVRANELNLAQMKFQEMALQSTMENERHATSMSIIQNIGSSGHYEYNPLSGAYDRWQPNR